MAIYDQIGVNYSALRRPDPRIAKAIEAALGNAHKVANIGAGTGSYEPSNCDVIAVEPSEVMIRQRPSDAAPCVQGVAEDLPLAPKSVDACMAILTTHHWPDLERGLREMARVARQRVVILTWVPDAPGASPFWLTERYFPQIMAHDRTIFPDANALSALLERAVGPTRMTPVSIPRDCIDGMLCAYWRRPEMYLRADVRAAISSFARIDAAAGLEMLREDLASGDWLRRHGALMGVEAMDLCYRLLVSEIARDTGAVRSNS